MRVGELRLHEEAEGVVVVDVLQVSNVLFWWLNLVRLYSLYEILYPKRRI